MVRSSSTGGTARIVPAQVEDKPARRGQLASVHVTTIAAHANVPEQTPLLFVHGGSHTGACWITTPGGEPGWAPYCAAQGRTSYVIDWPGRGKSIARGALHDMAMEHVAEEIAAVLADVGPAVLVTHSMGGVIGWHAAELAGTNVKAIVGIAPGPPANLQPPLDSADIVRIRESDPVRFAELGRPAAMPLGTPVLPVRETAVAMWANSDHFPSEHLEAYLATLVPESPHAMNQRANLDGSGLHIAGPDALAGIPMLIITGDQDPRHPRVTDEGIATYFGAEFMWLADRGMPGHGHLMMIERNNQTIADIFLNWLTAREL